MSLISLLVVFINSPDSWDNVVNLSLVYTNHNCKLSGASPFFILL